MASVQTRRDPWLEAVVHEHAAFVGRALRYLGVPELDLADACQEVFVVVHRKRASFVEGTSMRAWLNAIALGVARNARRRVMRRREVSADAVPPLVDPRTPEDAAQRGEHRLRALAMLDRLTDEQREVFVLYEVEQMTMAEIAEALDVPLQTGYSRLRVARSRMSELARGGS